MDRRTFLKTLASLGAAVALPAKLAVAETKEIDTAWEAASSAWDLFEVSEYRTLSYANFEEPQTRREAEQPQSLNIAGPREGKRLGVYKMTLALLTQCT